MKHILAYLLISAFLLHLAANLVVLLSFKINQDYIAEFLCIDKDVPESNCNGCCQLKKELDQQQDNKESFPQSENKKTEIQFFVNELINPIPFEDNHKLNSFFYLNNTGINNPLNIFHPPQKLHA